MSPTEIIAILALTVYAIFRQTRVDEVDGSTRFKIAIIYGIVGVCVGGFDTPSGRLGWVMIGISLVLSAVIGLIRGRYTKVWTGEDGRIMRQGTVFTVSLFILLIVAKFGLGAWASLDHIDDGAGFGEVLVMIAIMVAVQAEIVWRRAQRLASTTTSTVRPVAVTA